MKKTYFVITIAGVFEIEAPDIVDALIRANHQMGCRGITGVVEKGVDLQLVDLGQAA